MFTVLGNPVWVRLTLALCLYTPSQCGMTLHHPPCLGKVPRERSPTVLSLFQQCCLNITLWVIINVFFLYQCAVKTYSIFWAGISDSQVGFNPERWRYEETLRKCHVNQGPFRTIRRNSLGVILGAFGFHHIWGGGTANLSSGAKCWRRGRVPCELVGPLGTTTSLGEKNQAELVHPWGQVYVDKVSGTHRLHEEANRVSNHKLVKSPTLFAWVPNNGQNPE